MSDGLEQLGAALADRYRLERELGQGGMATVYLAQDLRHDRKVALKVLRPELAAVIGAGRFLAEIKTTANLQHPHILPLFDSGQVDGTVFYVMPFVAGESLRDRLARERQLPIDEAVRITREVADALSAAHTAGVIHRDIKPENILLQGGHALVADFGIALAASRADGTGRLTETGMSLGTPHYMSPEQAIGERTLDARTDIYALGCVLYEMLVGEPPFTGASAQAVLAKVMTERPAAPSVTRDTVPPGVESAVLTALAKLPVDRFATAAAFSDALTRPGDRPVTHQRNLPVARTAALIVGAIAAGVIGDRLLGRTTSTTTVGDVEPRRYTIVLPDSAPLAVNGALPYLAARSLTISPDGQRLVYLAETPSGRHLRLIRLDGGPSADLPHTENALLPTFSPDGQFIAFISGEAVQRLSLEDQSLVRLGGVTGWPSGLHWDPDGRIYVTRDSDAGCLRAMAEAGGAEGDVGQAACDVHMLGQRLPGTDWLLSHAYRLLGAVSTRTGMRQQIVRAPGEQNQTVGGTNPLLLPDGNLVFVRDSTVYGAPFDPTSLAIKGEPRALFSGIRREAGVGQVQWDLTASGTLVWVPGGDLGMAHLAFLDRTGSVVDTVFGPPAVYEGVTLSPDGRRIGVQRNMEGKRWIAILDLERRVEDEVAMPGPLILMYWLRSGRGMAVASGMSWASAISSGVVDTAGRLGTDSTDVNLLDESPDGSRQCGNRGGDFALWRRDDPGRPIKLDDLAFICHFSPDGNWVAWSRGNGVFGALVDALGTEARIQISEIPFEFHWSPDSRQIVYPGFGEAFYSQRVPARAGERPEAPRLLLKAPQYLDTPGPATGLGPDGRVLVILGPKAPRVTRLEVMTNFPTFVARKLKAATP